MENYNQVELCFPQFLNSSCKKPTFHWTKAILLKVLLAVISVITVALNLLVIVSVSHFRQLHTPTNILLLSLAVSDFLVGLLLMPGELFRNTSCWFLGESMCALYCYLVWQTLCASIGNVVLISVDRYIAICSPLHYSSRITLSKVKRLVCLSWFWSTSYSTVYMKDELIQPGRSNSCFGECTLVIDYIGGTVDFVLNFIFPVTVIIVLYMKVFVVALSQARTMRSHVTALTLQQSVKLRKSELKAARTLGVLVTVYLICFCPYYCYSFININLTSTFYASLLFFLCYFNSCLNPIIYALFYPWFRKAVKLIVTLQILQPGSREAKIL